MKLSGKCPKCGSNDIIRVDGAGIEYDLDEGAAGSAVYVKADVNRYICCYCGYIEEWIDEDDIEKILSRKKRKN